eukprot:m.138238 g.138238  ORF g.138238 m.138238 type:complete len:159 (-) comp13746_c0_seq1:126-602(-)
MFTKVKEAFSSLTASQIVLSITVGVVCGLFPVPGITTPVVALGGKLVGLPPAGHIVSQAINFAITPLCIFGVPYLACASNLVFGTTSDFGECTLGVIESLKEVLVDPFNTIPKFGSLFLQAIMFWTLALIPFGFILLYPLLSFVVSFIVPSNSNIKKE